MVSLDTTDLLQSQMRAVLRNLNPVLGATNARQANLRNLHGNLTEVVSLSGRSEHIGVTVMTHGARLILISVEADDFKEKLQVDFVFMSARH